MDLKQKHKILKTLVSKVERSHRKVNESKHAAEDSAAAEGLLNDL